VQRGAILVDNGPSATLEEAKAEFQKSWDAWKAKLEEANK
jgi:hypothetical protein